MEWSIDWANDLKKKIQGSYSILTWQGKQPPGLNWRRELLPPIALALGVLTSSWQVRVRRFCGFIAWGAVIQGVVVPFFSSCTYVRIYGCIYMYGTVV